MKLLVCSYKGGVGKTSIAYNMSQTLDCLYVTNDIHIASHPDIIQIEPRKRRIPKELIESDQDIIFDMGATSTNLDSKVTHALSIADLVIIPVLTDARSLYAAVETALLAREVGKPYIFIINNYIDERKVFSASENLRESLGPDIKIFTIRKTTLFERISREGPDFLHNVHNTFGAGKLLNTIEQHNDLYHRIQNLVVNQCS